MQPEETQLAIWRLFLERCRAEAQLESAVAGGDPMAISPAEVALASLPEVSALDALKANAELISRLSTQRWIAMKIARDQGANMEQIGAELGVSRQAAWEFLQRKIRDQGSAEDVARLDRSVEADARWETLQRVIEAHPGTNSADAWNDFVSGHQEGTVVDGSVIRVLPFGAFIEVAPEIAGLLPRSAVAELPEPGSKLQVQIVSLDHDARRMTFAPAD